MTLIISTESYPSVNGGDIKIDEEDGLPAIERASEANPSKVTIPNLGFYATTHLPSGGPCDDNECVRCSAEVPESFPD